MRTCIAAFTGLAPIYPGYLTASREDDGTVVVTMRGDPTVRDGCFVSGHTADKGKHGRCTPGDENCNNYCNRAPEKGAMADRPKDCIQTFEGSTVTVRLTASEWAALLGELSKDLNQ